MFPPFSLSLSHAHTYKRTYASTCTHLPLALCVHFLYSFFFVPIVVHVIAPNETSSKHHITSLSLSYLKDARISPLGRISHIIVIFVSEHNAFTYDVRKLKLLYFPAATHVPMIPIKIRELHKRTFTKTACAHNMYTYTHIHRMRYIRYIKYMKFYIKT